MRLEPLSLRHVAALAAVGLHPSLWRFTPERVSSHDDMRRYVAHALAAREAGSALPFATVDCQSDTVIGSTRFGSFVPEHRRVEIGWTWLAPAYQRTAANTEAKYLMLRHAFETLGLRRVEFKTSSLNTRSRAAILRLGAREEGTFRQHMLNADGSSRDTVYFSILDGEWPAVRSLLEARLAGRPAG